MHDSDHDHAGECQPQAVDGDGGLTRELAIEESQAPKPDHQPKDDLDERMGVQLDPREGDAGQQDRRTGDRNPAPAGRDIAGKQYGKRAIDRGADRGMAAGIADIGVEQGAPAGFQRQLGKADGNRTGQQRQGKGKGRAAPARREQKDDGQCRQRQGDRGIAEIGDEIPEAGQGRSPAGRGTIAAAPR